MDVISSLDDNSKQEIFDDDSSSLDSESNDEDEDDDYSLEDSYDCEVAHVHDHEVKLAE